MQYGVVIFPSKKLQDIVNSYRKRYDPQYALIPPHLTLKSTFEAGEEIVVPFAEKLRKIAQKHPTFPLKSTKISSFQPVNNVIYLKVDPTEELSNLQNDINQEYSEQNLKYSFVPHITIGQNLSHDEHSDVLGSLHMTKVNHEETVDRFHLVYQLENGIWNVYETFRLGKE